MSESAHSRWDRRRRRLKQLQEVRGPRRGSEDWVREVVQREHPPRVGVELPGSGTVELRLRSRDFETFKQVVVEDGYAFGVRHKEPRTIVDAGANIGLTAIRMATRYPQARIIAIEPDAGNFAMLERNLARFPRVTPLLAALVARAGDTRLIDPGLGEWGFRIDHDAETGTIVQGVDVPWLLERFQMPCIDLLKIDIEGAEKEVFESSASWIDKVNLMMVELHDRYVPGCSRAFFAATGAFEVEEHRGDNILVCRRAFLEG
jgi:FkbM family methyltransferase